MFSSSVGEAKPHERLSPKSPLGRETGVLVGLEWKLSVALSVRVMMKANLWNRAAHCCANRFLLAALAGLLAGGCHDGDSGPASAKGQEEEIVLHYLLPAAQVPGATPAAHHRSGGDSDGTSDPTNIVYDEARAREHVRWVLSGECIDGRANYLILTPEGPIKFHGGLAEAYLGTAFNAEDLTSFLQRRLDGKTVQREFHIKDPDLVASYRKRRTQNSERLEERLSLSPWDRDTVAVIYLLSKGRYAAARPLFSEMTHDQSKPVRYSAVLALGRIAPAAPEAAGHLARLLSDPELKCEAARALARGGDVGANALVRAMDHSDEAVRNLAMFALIEAGGDAGTKALLAALQHQDPSVRLSSVAVVLNMQSRGKDVSGDTIIKALADLLKDENVQTRRSAAISLLNLGPAAARAIPALRVAAKDPYPSVRRYATKAIRAIEGTPAEAR